VAKTKTIATDLAEIRHEANRVMLREAMTGERLTLDDESMIDAVYSDKNARVRMTGTIGSVAAWKRKAESPADRERAIANVERAKAVREEKTAALREEIERGEAARREITRLDANVELAEKAVEAHRIAIDRLRDFAPEHITRVFNHAMRDTAQKYRWAAEKQVRPGMIRNVVKLYEAGNINELKLHLDSIKHPALTYSERYPGVSQAEVNQKLLDAYVKELRVELPGLEAELAQAKKDRAAEEAELRKMLDYWINFES